MKSNAVFFIVATILVALTSSTVDAKNTRILSSKSVSSKGGKSSKSSSSKGKGGKSSKSPSSKGKGGKSSKSPSSKGKGKGKGAGTTNGSNTSPSGSNVASTPRPTPSPKVSVFCNGVQIFSDGICDLANNNVACEFDAQDCIIYNGANKLAQDCVKKSIVKGEPLTFPADETNRIGDGSCDEKYNNNKCQFDGGDCARRHLRY